MAASETSHLVVFTTFADLGDAKRVVRQLVEKGLVACGTLVPGVTSMYRWQGEIQEEAETLAILKTDGRCWSQLEETIREIHPYDVPEIVALPISRGSAPYLDWITQETATGGEG